MVGRPTATVRPLDEAASAALCALAAAGELMVVVGREPGLALQCLRDCPDRVVVAPGVASRFAVADGVWMAGRRVMTVLDDHVVDLRPAAECTHPTVLLTTHALHLAAARDAGLVVVQPSWPADVEPLLRGALTSPESVLVRLHDGATDGLPPEQPPELGIHRVLRRGRAGLLVAAGSGTPRLIGVATALSAQGIEVTAVEMHTIRPVTGIDPALTERALLAGPIGVEHARQLVPIPFKGRSTEDLTKAVLTTLPS